MTETSPLPTHQVDASANVLRIQVAPQSWAEALPLLLRTLESGRTPARREAVAQLQRMALVADIGNRAFAALARRAGTELDGDSAQANQVLSDVATLQTDCGG